MTYEQLTTFIVVLIGGVGLLVTIDKLIDLIKKYRKPSVSIQEQIKRHETQLQSDSKRISALEENMKEANKVQNKVLLQMCSHMAYGNHTDKLIEAKEELEEYLINH